MRGSCRCSCCYCCYCYCWTATCVPLRWGVLSFIVIYLRTVRARLFSLIQCKSRILRKNKFIKSAETGKYSSVCIFALYSCLHKSVLIYIASYRAVMYYYSVFKKLSSQFENLIRICYTWINKQLCEYVHRKYYIYYIIYISIYACWLRQAY